MSATVPPFAVVTGEQVQQVLDGREPEIVDLVEAAYRLHGAGNTVNPPSYFLRFPDRPDVPDHRAAGLARREDDGVDGLKWISSFPENVEHGMPRASAVLILNDPGHRISLRPVLESSIISAARTAASAALAADGAEHEPRTGRRRVGFIGTGLIARYRAHLPAGHRLGVRRDRRARPARRVGGRLPRLPRTGTGTTARITGHDDAGEPDPRQRPGRLRHRRRRAVRPPTVDWFAHDPLVLQHLAAGHRPGDRARLHQRRRRRRPLPQGRTPRRTWPSS
jgi:hypothetical protein